jgi:hypothetical protein
MKPLPLFVVSLAVAGFLLYAVYAYHHQPEMNHGYSKSDINKVSRLLNDQPAIVQLFADDGEPVDQRVKVTEWARARKSQGR